MCPLVVEPLIDQGGLFGRIWNLIDDSVEWYATQVDGDDGGSSPSAPQLRRIAKPKNAISGSRSEPARTGNSWACLDGERLLHGEGAMYPFTRDTELSTASEEGGSAGQIEYQNVFDDVRVEHSSFSVVEGLAGCKSIVRT